MQISTRTHDYLIDCIALRDALHCLLPSFANPQQIKVCANVSVYAWMCCVSVCVRVCVCEREREMDGECVFL